MSKDRFQGKIVLVTGGNSGIGLAAAQGFAQEGARVAIAGRDPQTLKAALASLPGDALAIQADVARLSDLDRVIGDVVQAAGRIDALFVNAGIGFFAPIEASDEDLFDRQFAVNVKGAYFTIQKALPHMQPGSAIVINASSVVGMGLPNSSVYTATKAAIASLARSLALELAPRGIRLNVVNPGPTETPIFDRMGLDPEAAKGMTAQITASVPLQRFGSPDEIARAVLFLASDEASFVHGAALSVDGGLTAL
ncbi:MAG: glucose 1-dehydrogenase [Planctomycetes bacterium]|nr:glucose 1-dehydrogenase [Planctomycetota bacterium]